jgi:restriction system protein
MMPRQQDMEIPLLVALEKLGGKARPQEVYAAVTKSFPELTDADLAEQLQSGGKKWTNRIQWVRQRLVERGEMESPSYGIWAITGKGLARLRGDSGYAQPPSLQPHAATSTVSPPPPTPQPAPPQASPTPSAQALPINFEEIVDDYLTAFKAKLLQKLHDLTPEKFEEFAAVLLRGYGFQKIKITGKAGDGGIDGHGELKVGLAVLRAAFQCKRWEAQVGSKEVQAFRGAIQGQFEQGYFFTTSTFSKAAQAESVKIGAAPVILFDGQQIAQVMIEKAIGVKRRPIEVYEDQIEELFESS